MVILMIVRRLLTKVVDGAEVLALAYGHGSGVIVGDRDDTECTGDFRGETGSWFIPDLVKSVLILQSSYWSLVSSSM